VSSHQIDHLLEQLELIFPRPHTAADNDALPRSGAQGISNDRLNVVAAVQADQASFDADAVLGESGYARLDCVGYRLRIPGPGDPVRVEPDHENAGRRGRCVHPWTLRRG
jgi:hypothetical protein